MKTIGEALREGILAIRESGVSTSDSLDAILLLCKATGLTKERIYARPQEDLTPEAVMSFGTLLSRRCAAEPMAYILGEREFYGRVFHVDARVLIPRPDTEILVEQALNLLESHTTATVLDLCTGSGCIGITIAAERPQATITLSDISHEALAVASVNMKANLATTLELSQGNLFESLSNRRFHMIITNPPYLASQWYQTTAAQVKHEPYVALVGGGEEGLDIIHTIVEEAPAYLEPEGTLLIECDDRQNATVAHLMEKAGFTSVSSSHDLAGCRRIVWGRLPCTRN
jgi:release factor glutamine methyltransferase